MLGDLLQEALRLLTGFDWVRACWRGIFWAPGHLPFLPALPSLDRNGYAVLCCLRFWMEMDAPCGGGWRYARPSWWRMERVSPGYFVRALLAVLVDLPGRQANFARSLGLDGLCLFDARCLV